MDGRKRSNMKLNIIFTFLFILLKLNLCPQVQDLDIIQFFNELYIQYKVDYQKIRNNQYLNFCEKYQIDKNNEVNQDKFLKLYFLHDLFTGSGVTDGSYGGILKIPYFWHWVNPNPRHRILRNSDRVNLTKIQPPPEFSRYNSFADIDRIPSLFLSDLFKDNANYYHPDCGEFYTFGWCSEREMSFCLLLSLLGYEGKIYQQGIHVSSQFWIEFNDKDNKLVIILADVDNTFDIIHWEKRSSNEKSIWLKDFGNGEQNEWYNKKARAKDEIKLVMNIKVSEKANKRIKKLVDEYLKNRKE